MATLFTFLAPVLVLDVVLVGEAVVLVADLAVVVALAVVAGFAGLATLVAVAVFAVVFVAVLAAGFGLVTAVFNTVFFLSSSFCKQCRELLSGATMRKAKHQHSISQQERTPNCGDWQLHRV